MSMMWGMRFDFRNPEFAGTTSADRYAASLEIAEWADRLGCVSISIAEHHSSPDEYIPSPVVMLAAMAARTKNVGLSVAALIAPFYDPLRLAEDICVLDQLSRGRVNLVVGGGYVHEEFEMYGIPMNERPKRVVELVRTLKGAFTGEPFEYRGRTVHVRPGPYRAGGPGVMLGGSSEGAARRAARIADGFVPTEAGVWEFYRDEVQKLGRPDPGPNMMGPGPTIALAADVERGWEQMGPYFLHETNSYGAWAAQDDVASPYRTMTGVEELRASGEYVVLTPDEYVEQLKEQDFAFPFLHPLCGGMPPEVAWSSLRLFEEKVIPAFD
jgi:alkanesulfonate monooxygenase SsuD/methylene tetrahydromethanopterin reductase-like flavin-dependent oxidoreductase (luciferase family)